MSLVSISPNGSEIAAEGDVNWETGNSHFFIMDLQGNIKTKIPMPEDSYSSDEFSWSPDGKSLSLLYHRRADGANFDSNFVMLVCTGDTPRVFQMGRGSGCSWISNDTLAINRDSLMLIYLVNRQSYSLIRSENASLASLDVSQIEPVLYFPYKSYRYVVSSNTPGLFFPKAKKWVKLPFSEHEIVETIAPSGDFLIYRDESEKYWKMDLPSMKKKFLWTNLQGYGDMSPGISISYNNKDVVYPERVVATSYKIIEGLK
jgi:hypothetical protein